MLSQLPFALQDGIKSSIEQALKENVTLIDFQPAAGGCINHGGRLRTSCGSFFVKWNDVSGFPGMFEAEGKGLKILNATKTLQVPNIIATGEKDGFQFLIISFISSGSRSPQYWKELGKGLADLHRCSGEFYGLDHNNFIGSLPQENVHSLSWINFFMNERLSKQLVIAANRGCADTTLRKDFDKFFSVLPSLLLQEKPSLLHGDLWSGNVMASQQQMPVIIDPAVYYGHREVDLGMTKLFGGFDKAFYQSYNESFPLEKGFEDRMNIYNLYPLLVHVNLFGQAYLRQVRDILRRYL